MTAPNNPLPAFAARATRAAAVFCLLALALLALAWEMWLAPLRPGGSWIALKALPLLLPLGGLWRYRLYTYRWVSLFVWLYFTEGVVRATSEKAPGSWLALGETLLCVALFVACVLHIRLRLKAAAKLPMQPEEIRQQANDKNAGNVEQQPHANHFAQLDLAGGVNDGIGRRGNGQHEGA